MPPLGNGNAHHQARRRPQAPRVEEVVFGAGPLERRRRRAVHVEEVVALAEPPGLGLDDVDHGARQMAAALDVERGVIAPGRRRQLLAVQRVQVPDIGRQLAVLLPVHLVVEHRHAPAALVGDGDAARPAERHRPIAVARASVGGVADHERIDVALVAVPDGEEIAQRHVDARRQAAVVVDAEAQQARPAVLVGGQRHPDVRHDARALQVGQDDGLAGDGALAVVVALHVDVVARGAPRLVVLEPCQLQRAGEPLRLRARRESGGQKRHRDAHHAQPRPSRPSHPLHPHHPPPPAARGGTTNPQPIGNRSDTRTGILRSGVSPFSVAPAASPSSRSAPATRSRRRR